MLRSFTDTDGVAWRVWDVNPVLHARGSTSVGKRTSLTVPAGWLCFECDQDRRRLSPIPEGWEALDERALQRLRDRAVRVPRVS